MNTVIITEENGGINSKDFLGYALQPYYEPADHDDVGYGTREESSGLRLIACGENREDDILICLIAGSDYTKRATRVLNNLLTAIQNNKRIWDIEEEDAYIIPF